jgi:hypothetical protein
VDTASTQSCQAPHQAHEASLLPAPAPAPVLVCLVYGTSNHTLMGCEMLSLGPCTCGLVERAQVPGGGRSLQSGGDMRPNAGDNNATAAKGVGNEPDEAT